jgi:hypothetical protein
LSNEIQQNPISSVSPCKNGLFYFWPSNSIQQYPLASGLL